MPAYEYWATTEIGDAVSGKLSAASPDAASHLLKLRGLSVRRLEELAEPTPPIPEAKSSPADDVEADLPRRDSLTVHKLPLITSLRTLIEESPRPKLRRAVMQVITLLEQGQPLDVALAQLQSALPRRMEILFEAGLKTGRLPLLLDHTIEHLRRAAELRRGIWLKLLYPLCMIGIGILLCFGVIFLVVPTFSRIFDDFGTELPGLTVALISVSRLRVWEILALLLLTLVLVGIATVILRITGGRRRIHQLVGLTPLLGTLLRSASLSGFFRMLSILLDAGFSLPEALQLAAAVNGDAVLADSVNHITADLERGIAPLDAVRVTEAFPREVLPVFRWSEKPALFTEALHGAADIYAARSQMNTGVLAVILEPLVIFGLGLFMGTIVLALFMPLIKLLNDLA